MYFTKVVSTTSPLVTKIKQEIAEYLFNNEGLALEGIAKDEVFDLATKQQLYKAVSAVLRKRVMESWAATNKAYKSKDAKQAYYLSLEFLIGRSMGNNALNMGMLDYVSRVLAQLGISINEIEDQEMDAGLGNGGLGRLAACFVESAATLHYPVHGYGIRYDEGIFIQKINDGYQIERPDTWLQDGNAWEIAVKKDAVDVHFGGTVVTDDKRKSSHVEGYENVRAVPFDMPVVGYAKKDEIPTINRLRLWSTSLVQLDQFDMPAFDRGDYMDALKKVYDPGNASVTQVLYPNDNHYAGKQLRLKQEFLLVSASLQDIIRAYKKDHDNFDDFAKKAAIQINDTHPALCVAELMRLLVDTQNIPWNKAWEITKETVAYTNHTVLPEALEKWPADMMKQLLPRQYQIIEEINMDFCNAVRAKFPGDDARVDRMSIINGGLVKMAHLAVVGGHSVNGVAALHSEIIKESVLKDFYEMYPEKFGNVTNGVTIRRWMVHANPELSSYITELLGSDEWITDASKLKGLEKFADDPDVQKKWMDIKRTKKEQLAKYIATHNPIRDSKGYVIGSYKVDPEAIFDSQSKRLHEYKRQLMNALHIMMLYNRVKRGETIPKRVFFFGAKAAPGYGMAKDIIKLITNLSKKINNDPDVKGLLQVVFVENYNVSNAEILIPGSDVSEQISTAGKEASGTGNMKYSLNGAITIGTMDGANVEMAEEIGEENMFIFGLSKDDVNRMNEEGYNPWDYYHADANIKEVIDQLWSGEFSFNGDNAHMVAIADALMHGGDEYKVLADLGPYAGKQEELGKAYMDESRWAKLSILQTARMGKFSSDRSIEDYVQGIWGLDRIDPNDPE